MIKIKSIIAVFVFLLIALFPLSVPASASHQTGKLNYLIATGVLCGLPEPNPCPAISMAGNGDTVELTGEGSIDLGARTATGGGTFVHKDGDGNVLGTGDWHAMDLISFRSWGSGEEFPPNFEGGRAKLRVHLAPDSGGEGFLATLRVICTIGNVPKGAEEGIQLSVKHGPNFKEQVSGLTLFVRTE
ncbi:hypothetical protein HYZ70_00970 [Candidatus Curtissbacteria bacterium]|nr:hypothetical protein [Candidatus Curtissbacteria bacterium]